MRYEELLAAGDIDTVVTLYTEDCRIFVTEIPPVIGRVGTYVHNITSIPLQRHSLVLDGRKITYQCIMYS